MAEFNDNGYFPTFEPSDNPDLYDVYWRGQRWGLVTPIQDSWQRQLHGIYASHETTKVELAFTMVKLPPKEPPTPHDNIILGDN